MAKTEEQKIAEEMTQAIMSLSKKTAAKKDDRKNARKDSRNAAFAIMSGEEMPVTTKVPAKKVAKKATKKAAKKAVQEEE